jgi:hypothetical protein
MIDKILQRFESNVALLATMLKCWVKSIHMDLHLKLIDESQLFDIDWEQFFHWARKTVGLAELAF